MISPLWVFLSLMALNFVLFDCLRVAQKHPCLLDLVLLFVFLFFSFAFVYLFCIYVLHKNILASWILCFYFAFLTVFLFSFHFFYLAFFYCFRFILIHTKNPCLFYRFSFYSFYFTKTSLSLGSCVFILLSFTVFLFSFRLLLFCCFRFILSHKKIPAFFIDFPFFLLISLKHPCLLFLVFYFAFFFCSFLIT